MGNRSSGRKERYDARQLEVNCPLLGTSGVKQGSTGDENEGGSLGKEKQVKKTIATLTWWK